MFIYDCNSHFRGPLCIILYKITMSLKGLHNYFNAFFTMAQKWHDTKWTTFFGCGITPYYLCAICKCCIPMWSGDQTLLKFAMNCQPTIITGWLVAMETRRNKKIRLKNWSNQPHEHPKTALGFHGFKCFNANKTITIFLGNKHILIYLTKKKIVGTDFF